MAEAIINDWISDYKALQTSEIKTFAAQHVDNHEVSTALYTVFNERNKYTDLLHPICDQLYSFYRSQEIELKRFTLQFIPILIYIYLNSVTQGDKKNCRSIETLLISIYNIEISTDDGQPKIVSYRMPILAQASIYHEEKSLHPSDLRRWEENCNKDVKWGPLQQIESINAQNRLKIMTALLFIYNQQLSLIQKSSLYHLCRITSQLVNQGFTKYGHAHRSSYGNDPTSNSLILKPLPRIQVSSKFLLELLHAIYFAMFNEFASVAIQSVDDIHHRACYEMLSDVIIVTNAVKNSLHANPSGQPSDGPMGISVALTPATSTVTISKSMITNASFRTKKLPDDIPIQNPNAVNDSNANLIGAIASNNASGLVSITEENENDVHLGNRGSVVRNSKENTKSHKHAVPSFAPFKKSKDHTKDKDKDKEKDKEKDKDKDKETKQQNLYKSGLNEHIKDATIGLILQEQQITKRNLTNNKNEKLINRNSFNESINSTEMNSITSSSIASTGSAAMAISSSTVIAAAPTATSNTSLGITKHKTNNFELPNGLLITSSASGINHTIMSSASTPTEHLGMKTVQFGVDQITTNNNTDDNKLTESVNNSLDTSDSFESSIDVTLTTGINGNINSGGATNINTTTINSSGMQVSQV